MAPSKMHKLYDFGAHDKGCPLNKIHKPSKPPVAVYVAKTNTPLPQPNNEKSRKPMRQTIGDIPRREEGEVLRERKPDKHDDRAWDENFIDVHVLDLGDQFVHCRITSRAVNETVFVTIVYCASEVIDRRILWTTLETLAQQCSDIPWLVGGDFNAVRELNEYNRAEFKKRLDRILINDRWLARFPTSSYHSLTPQTSDHSPLVLHGDTQQHNGGGMFRLDNYLAHSPDFIPNVQNIWHHEVVGIPMYAGTFGIMRLLVYLYRMSSTYSWNIVLDEAQQLVSSDRQNELYLLLEHCCRIIYAKAAKLEQIMLQQRAKMKWMKDGDQCSRVFFCKIGQRRVMRKILQINDENGTTHTDQGEVAHEFVSYFQNLLGGTRRQFTVDIRYLRPWARYCITDEEASHLLLPFSPDDVKQAVFDIAEDKAPGPDGYSSGFFKAAWPVVGEEVTRAVLDFFTTGKLLKQINSTILTLIPKRLSSLPDKIISPCQTAFIPERSIGENIMLAQELFSGYNQMRLPPRCALKVDIKKAYDTVEWDFLLAVLQLFGFPTKFTRLCSKVFQLGFADDLLLFCRADFDSISVFKEGLEWFAELSGLWLNVQKSHLIISCSAQELKDQMLEI
ncbi:uncharacterized protein LOC105179104 [Sesamum indicum]|uniref:Uncharacterized protein LOC105179104 n=1 Tax=Sesamum indicum TaxID=4182 RepID=A0A6I9V0C5_SESIN|nr:uncharacterized protein LOC105179104 [Sesamum indicum]